MKTFTSRRDWLKASITLTSSLTFGPALASQLMASPVSDTERKFNSTRNKTSLSLRLNSNENPYGPSDKAKEAIKKIVAETNRYPFDTVKEFKQILAKHEGISPDHIAIGAGSADLLCASGAAFGIEGGRILSPFPTFPVLMNYAEVFNCTWDKINVNEKLECDYNALASAIKADTRLVFICNPNNPTGTLVDPKIVKAFCEEISPRVTVYADEAYLEFPEPSQQVSMVELVKQGKNVVVSRTFSKIHGLAGLRVGYIIAQPDVIRKIARYQHGFPDNQVGLAAAKASLGDHAFMELTRKKNAEARKHLTDYLEKKKFTYGKSATNFVFFKANNDAYQTLAKLSEKGIGIRVWDYDKAQWYRVSIGTREEMNKFTRAFEEII